MAQLLRHIQKTGGITYLVGLARFSSRENLKEVEDNLTRGDRPQDHGFFVVERVFLPLGGSKLHQRLEMQCFCELGRGESLPLLGAGQIELQTLSLCLYAERVSLEYDADAHRLIELLFVTLRNGQSLAHDIHKSASAHQVKVLLGGCET